MEDRQRLESMVNELNAYQQQAEVLQQQIDSLNATITELSVAMDTYPLSKEKTIKKH